jgi:hypothetical protein
MVEKIIAEIENELLNPTSLVLTKIASKKSEEDLDQIKLVLAEVKAFVGYMAIKYNLKPKKFELENILRAQKAKMWEMLCDSNSKGLRGFGKFPEEYATEFDKDIDDLQELIKKI